MVNHQWLDWVYFVRLRHTEIKYTSANQFVSDYLLLFHLVINRLYLQNLFKVCGGINIPCAQCSRIHDLRCSTKK